MTDLVEIAQTGNTSPDWQTQIRTHHPFDASKLIKEINQSAGKAHYDPAKRKVAYHSPEDALAVYDQSQTKEMMDHRWIESQKANKDLGEKAYMDWILKFSALYAAGWRTTHVFVPTPEELKEAAERAFRKIINAREEYWEEHFPGGDIY